MAIQLFCENASLLFCLKDFILLEGPFSVIGCCLLYEKKGKRELTIKEETEISTKYRPMAVVLVPCHRHFVQLFTLSEMGMDVVTYTVHYIEFR
jgi:hypothetical protein